MLVKPKPLKVLTSNQKMLYEKNIEIWGHYIGVVDSLIIKAACVFSFYL